jgi:hypothetical protein
MTIFGQSLPIAVLVRITQFAGGWLNKLPLWHQCERRLSRVKWMFSNLYHDLTIAKAAN